MTRDCQQLEDIVAQELAHPVPSAVRTLAAQLAAEGGPNVAASLFYGSCLRRGDTEGLVDLYVLVDRYTGWHLNRLAAALNRLLPPNVMYREMACVGMPVRAKIAVISRRAFEAAVHAKSIDTTIWARACQPVALVYARDETERAWAVERIAEALACAAFWAVHLGPRRASADRFWTALFQKTYGAELRVEDPSRAAEIVSRHRGRYARVMGPALAHAGIDWSDQRSGCGYAVIAPAIGEPARRAARARWLGRRAAGKALNAARLCKAAFTFEGGGVYIEWKIERHTGQAIGLTAWQRNHPLLAAPVILIRAMRAKRRGGGRRA